MSNAIYDAVVEIDRLYTRPGAFDQTQIPALVRVVVEKLVNTQRSTGDGTLELRVREIAREEIRSWDAEQAKWLAQKFAEEDEARRLRESKRDK